MNFFIKLQFLVLWVILGFMGVEILVEIIQLFIIPNFKYFQYFYYGIVSYIIIFISIDQYRYRVVVYFFHEFAHAFFALLTLSKIDEFTVSANGKNEVKITSLSIPVLNLIRDHLYGLSPYFFPTLTTIFLGVYWYGLTNPDYILESFGNINILIFLIGFTYAFHFIVGLLEINPIQSDFDNLGFFYGIIFVFFMKICFALLMLLILSKDFGSIDYFINSIRNYEYLYSDLQYYILEVKIFLIKSFN